MLEGRLVRLRALEPEDVDTLWRFINDLEVTAHLARRYPLSRAAQQEFVDANREPGFAPFTLGIVSREDERIIGGCGFHVVHPENRCAELGIMIGEKSLWGRGFGTDAMRVLCAFGFDEMNLNRIELVVHDGNPRAERCYEKVGFVREGVARQAVYKRGRYIDEITMGLLRDEFVRA